MTNTEAATKLMRTTNWSVSAIATVLGMEAERVSRVADNCGDRRVGEDASYVKLELFPNRG